MGQKATMMRMGLSAGFLGLQPPPSSRETLSLGLSTQNHEERAINLSELQCPQFQHAPSNLCYFCPLREFSGSPQVCAMHTGWGIGTGASSSTRGDFWGPGLQCQGLGTLLPGREMRGKQTHSFQTRFQQSTADLKGSFPREMAPPLKRANGGRAPRPLP